MELLRSRLGPCPRGEPDASWTTTAEGAWKSTGGNLMHQVTLQKALVTYGEVVWGRVALASSLAWESGTGDVQGVVVFSFDRWFDNRPSALAPIADSLFSFYGENGAIPDEPWLRHTADMLRAGIEDNIGLSIVLPPGLTRARRVLMSSILIERAHLPDGYLQSNLVPLVAARGGPIRPVRVIPSALWPAQLRSMWAQNG